MHPSFQRVHFVDYGLARHYSSSLRKNPKDVTLLVVCVFVPLCSWISCKLLLHLLAVVVAPLQFFALKIKWDLKSTQRENRSTSRQGAPAWNRCAILWTHLDVISRCTESGESTETTVPVISPVLASLFLFFTATKMDIDARERLRALLNKYTKSNVLLIPHEIVIELKSILKGDDGMMELGFEHLFHILASTHPQSRLLSLMLINVFFQRSKHFRTLLVNNLTIFFELTLGINPKKRLPPPQKTARYLVNPPRFSVRPPKK